MGLATLKAAQTNTMQEVIRHLQTVLFWNDDSDVECFIGMTNFGIEEWIWMSVSRLFVAEW